MVLFNLFFSPQIKAASEKLAKLHSSPSVTSQDDKTSSVTMATTSEMPPASADVLEAQRKRFEELKVSLSVWLRWLSHTHTEVVYIIIQALTHSLFLL